MTETTDSHTAAGTALWREVAAAHERGDPGAAERAEAQWAALSPEAQAAATRAGTALWREATGRPAR